MTRTGLRSLRIALALLAVLAAGIRASAAQAPGAPESPKGPRATTIKGVQIERSGDVWIVKIEADGPLPAPKIGELDAPARVFLDFSGVRARTGTVQGVTGAPVVRVRTAVNSTSPLVARVVIDLAFKQPIRTEDKQIATGLFNVLIGEVAPTAAEASASAKATADKSVGKPNAEPPAPNSERPAPAEVPRGIPPVGSLPPPVRPGPPPDTSPASGPPSAPASAPSASPVPARTTTAPVPPKDAERYLEQIGPTLTRYRKLRPALANIDRQDPKPPEDLTAVREECAAVLRALTAHRASDALRPTHDLLVRSASFALMAATLRNDVGMRADPEKLRNAASAAAGALLLLDRACAELGCSAAEPGR
jgi:hypothetical protein